jgi:TonB family protein
MGNVTSLRGKVTGTESNIKWSVAASLALHFCLFLSFLIAASIPSKYHFDQTTFIEVQGFIPEPVNSEAPSVQPATQRAPDLAAKRRAIAVKKSQSLKAEPESGLRDRIMQQLRSTETGSVVSHASNNTASQPLPGITTGVPFPFATYLSDIRDRINAAWHQPDWLSAKTSQAKAIVVFRIHRDGTTSSVLLAIPSGIDAMDRSVVTAVLSANPLPPLPKEFKGNFLDVHLQFHLSR